MSLLEHQSDIDTGPPSRTGRAALIGLILIGGAAAAYVALAPTDEEEPVVTTTAADPPPVAANTPEPEPEPVAEPSAPEPEPVPEPDPTPAPVIAKPSVPESRLEPLLRVASDVPGASVFLDRRFLGTTPFETGDVPSGPHRLNVSSEGHEGFFQEIEIGDELVSIDVRFLEVRLAASVDVVHKHRFGSCAGRLRADLDGVHYETTDDDAFSIPFSELEQHVVEYLEHTLTIRRRDGRTYNFTDEQESADALFTFHREVERARERLSP
ncbi:MAG TPA: PEGA domain-containing protein [Acidobacteria bacterium]|nr:PEGA domain-containing protein [Acidobacteriota bacterium]